MGVNTLPTKVLTKIPDLKLKSEKIKVEFKNMLKEAHQEASLNAKDTLKDAIRFKNAVATETLVNAVYRKLLAKRNGDEYVTNIGFQKPASEYAFFANYGRHEGKRPPYAAIEKWAAAKHGIHDVAFIWSVVNKIGAEGTKGTHFIEYAEARIEKRTAEIVAKHIEEFKRKLSNV